MLDQWRVNGGNDIFSLRIHVQFGVNINWLLTGMGEPYLKEGPDNTPRIEDRDRLGTSSGGNNWKLSGLLRNPDKPSIKSHGWF